MTLGRNKVATEERTSLHWVQISVTEVVGALGPGQEPAGGREPDPAQHDWENLFSVNFWVSERSHRLLSFRAVMCGNPTSPNINFP